MPKFEDKLDTFQASNRQAWREWLEQNYSTSVGVWLIYRELA